MFPEQMQFNSNKWLRATGDLSDVVITSRVRLARNLQDIPFTRWALPDDLASVVSRFRRVAEKSPEVASMAIVDFPRLDDLEKEFLCERHLISREFAEGRKECLLALNTDETISVMVNEEDHLRMQALRSGVDLHAAWEELNAIDDALEKGMRFAFDERWGYLTACPTNIGTGLRCSVMLHLPGLVLTQQIDKVLSAASQLNLAVRGFFGEGSDNTGNLFQISNQITLGATEAELIQKVSDIADRITKHERQVQRGLRKHATRLVEDRVWRAYGLLTNARMLTTREVLEHLSDIRLGISLDLVESVDLRTCNEILFYAQPAHLQRMAGQTMEPSDRDAFRADYVRRTLARTDS